MITKYSQLLRRSEREVKDEEIDFAVNDSLHDLEGNINQTKRQISKIENDIIKQKSNIPIDWDNLSKLVVQKEGYEKGLEILEGFKKELFSELPDGSDQSEEK